MKNTKKNLTDLILKKETNMISVVIPVYNVKSYLYECVESVRSQTYKDIEIILVNDGSTDGSDLICEELAELDNRIIVIHKDNGGLSDARNVGIDQSKGDYIMFVDSDDYWTGDFLKEIALMIDSNPKLDFITADGYLGKYPKGKVIHKVCSFDKDNFVYQNGEDFLEFVIKYKHGQEYIWHWNAWRNVYRSSLIKDNNLYFKKGIINEDAEWTPKVILASNYFDYYQKPFYVYRLSRPNSIMNVCSPKKVNDYLDTVEYWLDYANKISNQGLATGIKERYSNDFFSYLSYTYLFDKLTREKLITRFELSKFLEFVTNTNYLHLVQKIKKNGFRPTLLKMNLKYRVKEYIKKFVVRLKLVDR